MGIIDRQCEEGYNFQGYLMKIIKYINANDIFVEFQDEYKAIVQCFNAMMNYQVEITD